MYKSSDKLRMYWYNNNIKLAGYVDFLLNELVCNHDQIRGSVN